MATIASADPAPGRIRLRVPLITLLVWGAINAVGQFVEWNDEAIGWLIFVSSTALATIVLLVWLAFFSAAPRRFAVLPLIAAVVGMVAFFSIYRIDFLGNMRFRFMNRWGPTDADLKLANDIKADAAVAAPPIGPADFPQFLGPERTGVVRGRRLARDWQANPPRLLWKQRIGSGFSGFAAVGPWAVTQEQRGEDEMVTCYLVADGALRWTHTNRGRFTQEPGGVGPRATPTIHDGRVYTLGATGILDCLDFASGKLLWTHNIIEENSAKNDNWGKSNSPLIVDEKVVVSAGGQNGNSLVAYHRLTGKRLWSGGDNRSSYASPTLMTLAGTRQIVVVNEDQIAAHDPSNGKMLWERYFKGKSSSNASNTQPHNVGGNRIFISKGYGIGAQVFEVSRDASGKWTTTDVWPEDEDGKKVLKSKLSNVTIHNGFAYGLDDGTLQCVDLATGESQWKKGRYGHGQQLLVENLLLVMAEDSGKLHLIDPTPDEFKLLGQIQALKPSKAWNHLCLVGPYLLVRNDEEAACYELALAP